jgi:hypothetical protein
MCMSAPTRFDTFFSSSVIGSDHYVHRNHL